MIAGRLMPARNISVAKVCQGRTSQRPWRAIPAEQASHDGLQGVPVVEAQTGHCSPLETHDGHGYSTSRRRSFRDCIVAGP